MIQLTASRVDQLQIVLNDDETVEFAEDDFDQGLWDVWNYQIIEHGPEVTNENEEREILKEYGTRWDASPYKEFYKEIKGKDLKARIFLGWHRGKCQYKMYEDWEQLAQALGVSELVTLATKVPKVVAKRFAVFANQKGDRSSVLRKLVYDYVKQQMVDQADTLMFKENI